MYGVLCLKVLIKKIYPLKFVLCVGDHLLGEKNGKIAGMRLNIAQKPVVGSVAQLV
jgi:hypothetical protein